ncbi:hypothetical protein BC332_25864 [Capsicum chinense]|nr:hypothetical protein BC332_25864 [Capsicum chinense]
MISLHSPSMVFLSETNNQENVLRRVQRQLNMYHAIIVDPIGLAGGLCLLWNNEVQVCQHHSTSFYIETYVHDITVNSKQWFVFVYLSTDKTIRRNQLQELCGRYNSWGPIWVMAGDFNDIRDNSEKIGGRVRDESSFTDFKNFLWEIGAIDLGFNGKPWTCMNDNLIREVTSEEIKKVTFDMNPLKAPEVDDASLQKKKNMTSIGMTAMDSSGNLLQALGSPLQFVGKTIIAKALAIRIALEKAQEMDGQRRLRIAVGAVKSVTPKFSGCSTPKVTPKFGSFNRVKPGSCNDSKSEETKLKEEEGKPNVIVEKNSLGLLTVD